MQDDNTNYKLFFRDTEGGNLPNSKRTDGFDISEQEKEQRREQKQQSAHKKEEKSSDNTVESLIHTAPVIDEDANACNASTISGIGAWL